MKLVRESQSLPGLIAGLAKRHGDRCALGQAHNSGQASLSYRELWEGVQRGAARLADTGLAKGDRVMLCLEARPEWPAALFAIMYAGLVAVPVVQGMPPEMVAAIATHAGARGLVGGRDAHSELPAVGSIEFRFIADELLAPGGQALSEAATARDDVALLAFTSGSTQQPRAVVLTHGNLLADLAALLEVRDAKPGDAFLSILPPAHLFEFMVGQIGPLACGAKVVYPGTRLPNRLVESLREDRITHACCVPALLHCLYDELLDELIAAGVIEPERRGQSVSETARRKIDRINEQSMVSRRQKSQQRHGNSSQTGRHDDRSGAALQFVHGSGQCIAGRRAARPVGVALIPGFHRPRIGKQDGGSVHDRRIDEAVIVARIVATMRQQRVDSFGAFSRRAVHL